MATRYALVKLRRTQEAAVIVQYEDYHPRAFVEEATCTDAALKDRWSGQVTEVFDFQTFSSPPLPVDLHLGGSTPESGGYDKGRRMTMTTAVQTNATDPTLAERLSEIAKLDQGTLALLNIHKKGVSRGPAGSKTIYGDDFVEVLVWTGFDYLSLVQRSWKKLCAMQAEGNLVKTLVGEVQAAGYSAVTVADVCQAIQELSTNFLNVIQADEQEQARIEAGLPARQATADNGDEAEQKSVWKPLEVDGQKVKGSKVYMGLGDPNNPRAPKPGNVYIDGVKLGEHILEPAGNGHWKAAHKPKTVAKDILRARLPIGLYVRYSLEPDRLLSVLVGDAASAKAKADNVPIDPSAIRSLFKIAP